MTSNFTFLRAEFPALYTLGKEAEFQLDHDPAAALFKLRLFGEKLVDRLFAEHQLPSLAENTQHRRLEELKYQGLLPRQVEDILQLLKRRGNKAAHENAGTLADASVLLESAYHLGKWLLDAYGSTEAATPPAFELPEYRDTEQELLQLEAEKQTLAAQIMELQAALAARPELSEPQRVQLQQKAQKAADNLHLSEAETRAIIDEQLRTAGWEADTVTLRYNKGTRPEKGRNLAIAEWQTESGPADYALFVGLSLVGVVEAKRKNKDVSAALQQAKRYAKDIKFTTGSELLKGAPWGEYRTPFLFATNGRPYHYQLPEKSGIWFLDGRKPSNHARALRGWYSPDALLELHKQDIDAAEAALKADGFDYLRAAHGLGLRDYQVTAIERVEETIEANAPERRALLAMATGTGKTRTILGLVYRLLKSNRYRRILFLVDRKILGNQATDAFNEVKMEGNLTLAEIYDLKELKDKLPESETRLHVATVQSLVKRIYYAEPDTPVLPVDAYDCIIVDEAHRGYTLDREMAEPQISYKDQLDFLSTYKLVLDYFDAFRIGLTATPALHTVEIFGHPVFRYTYRQAVIDGYLIDHEPPILLKTKLNQEGIVWEAGSTPQAFNPETQTIEDLDVLPDELKIDVDGFNKLVLTESFNRTIAQMLVEQLSPDDKEKTLVFAATDEHADLLVRILKEEFRELGIEADDDAIIKITGSADKPQQLVKKFKNEHYPTIVVTVDLLTTGVDIPHICNLVFLRRVKSRILYEQMLGRATRRADDIGKETFKIYDAVRLYEALDPVTTMKPVVADPSQSIEDLTAELDRIESSDAQKQQVEQILAKLQRKRKKLSSKQAEQFEHNTKGQTLAQFIDYVRSLPSSEAAAVLQQHLAALTVVSEAYGVKKPQLYSNHQDVALDSERGYGGDPANPINRPEDYLQSFAEFVQNQRNHITALNIICTNPQELTRPMLKELKLLLDQQGFTDTQLNVAWKKAKKQEIGADIVAYIRSLALGVAARPLDIRVREAVDFVRNLKEWNKHQLQFLKRVEDQLRIETVLTRDDLNREPFKGEGGYNRFNKLFNNELDGVLLTIQERLYVA
ncbi:type I restriction-modification system endonuclease [Hymenobacter sp. DG01]|uniref:type I restriction-modification system endonuclease n=1 Tax=Hymenobacter sp. DG01 TaxID=2584940 RepID=UPI00111F1BE9|nr:type I restriction-modification system endonuclease [Hymenobacter sp. DG01]